MARVREPGHVRVTGKRLGEAIGLVEGNPRIVLTPPDAHRAVHLAEAVDDGRRVLGAQRGDLPVEGSLTGFGAPGFAECGDPFLAETRAVFACRRIVGCRGCRTRDVFADQCTMESRWEGRKDTFVLGDEAEERRTPRIESDDVEQIQRREIAALEQVRAERDSTADVRAMTWGFETFQQSMSSASRRRWVMRSTAGAASAGEWSVGCSDESEGAGKDVSDGSGIDSPYPGMSQRRTRFVCARSRASGSHMRDDHGVPWQMITSPRRSSTLPWEVGEMVVVATSAPSLKVMRSVDMRKAGLRSVGVVMNRR